MTQKTFNLLMAEITTLKENGIILQKIEEILLADALADTYSLNFKMLLLKPEMISHKDLIKAEGIILVYIQLLTHDNANRKRIKYMWNDHVEVSSQLENGAIRCTLYDYEAEIKLICDEINPISFYQFLKGKKTELESKKPHVAISFYEKGKRKFKVSEEIFLNHSRYPEFNYPMDVRIAIIKLAQWIQNNKL